MSWDVELTTEVDGHRVVIPNTSRNYTHNCNGMIREAGFDEWPYAVDGWPARDVGFRLALVIEELVSKPEKYKQMDPKNGWGSYDSLIPVLQEVAESCIKYPSATFSMWA